MFTTLLIAGTYLNRIADYIVQGVPVSRIGEIFVLLLPAVLVKTFAMSSLLASLLAFGRLSGDSEIVALRAGGASLWRILVPVALFATVVAGTAFYMNESLVPNAAKRSVAIATELSRQIKSKGAAPIVQPQYDGEKLTMMIAATDFSLAERALRNVTLTLYDEDGRPTYYVFAPKMTFESRQDWRVEGGGVITSIDGSVYTTFAEAWPTNVPAFSTTPEEIAAQRETDPDFSSMAELGRTIERMRRERTISEPEIRRREYWYWSKIALPLAALMFGTLGAGLGIRSARTGTATGFALAIGILFGYLTITNFMNVWAKGGIFPPWLASFTPIVIGAAATVVIVARKNR